MNGFKKVLGEKMQKYRKAINMSTTTLSELTGTAQSTISKIENGNSTTNIETLIKICEALGISLYDLLPENVLPEYKMNSPEKKQLFHVINQMSESEIKLVRSFLTTNILPVLKNIIPIVEALDQLNDNERKCLSAFLNSITDN